MTCTVLWKSPNLTIPGLVCFSHKIFYRPCLIASHLSLSLMSTPKLLQEEVAQKLEASGGDVYIHTHMRNIVGNVTEDCVAMSRHKGRSNPTIT